MVTQLVSVSLCDVESYRDPNSGYNCCHCQIGQRTLGKKVGGGREERGIERKRKKEEKEEWERDKIPK